MPSKGCKGKKVKHFLSRQVVSCIAANYTGIMDENTPSSQAARTSRKRLKGFRTFFKRTKNDERKRLAQRSQAKKGKKGVGAISQNVPVTQSRHCVPEFVGGGTQELG